MDNGKIRIKIQDGIPIIEVYHNGELQLADVIWVNHTLLHDIEPPLQLPKDIIIDRSGSYSLSEDAYLIMQELMQESARVAYVIHAPAQEVIVDLAANSYLSDKRVGKFASIKDALNWFQEGNRDNSSEDTQQPRSE